MSGEMNTSLSNGFANLMVQCFMTWLRLYGVKVRYRWYSRAYLVRRFYKFKRGVDLRIRVEGDDGIMKTRDGKFSPPEDYALLGFSIKIQIHPDPARASFCGIVYHPDECINVTDPREVLCQFGWASQRYSKAGKKNLMALLRCKALCYLHQYPGCPIIQELALYGLRMTAGYDVKSFMERTRGMSMWEREQVLAAVEARPVSQLVGTATRALVEDLYGVSIEVQLRLESYLRNMNELKPLIIDLIDWPSAWVEYFNEYCFEMPVENCSWQGAAPYVLDLSELAQHLKVIPT